MPTVRKNVIDGVILATVISLSAIIFILSGDFPSGTGGEPGAGFFPQFVTGCIIIFSIMLLLEQNLKRNRRAEPITVEMNDVYKFSVPTFILLLYLVLLPYGGFIITTICFCVVFMRYSGVEMYHKSLLVSVCLTLSLQLIFGSFLNIYLPVGIEPIAKITNQLPLTLLA